MRSQNYGDKQREEQQRKKQDELRKKTHPEVPPAAEPPKADAEDAQPASKKRTKKVAPDKPSRKSGPEK